MNAGEYCLAFQFYLLLSAIWCSSSNFQMKALNTSKKLRSMNMKKCTQFILGESYFKESTCLQLVSVLSLLSLEFWMELMLSQSTQLKFLKLDMELMPKRQEDKEPLWWERSNLSLFCFHLFLFRDSQEENYILLLSFLWAFHCFCLPFQYTLNQEHYSCWSSFCFTYFKVQAKVLSFIFTFQNFAPLNVSA